MYFPEFVTISVRVEFFQINGVDQADVRCQPLSLRGTRCKFPAMNAFQLVEHGSPGRFELRTAPDPKPAADGVVVKMNTGCGGQGSGNSLGNWLFL